MPTAPCRPACIRGQLSELLVRTIGRGSPVSLTPDDLTPRSRRILERAAQQARKNGCALAGTEHILASILAERESFAVRFLEEIGVNERELLRTVTDTLEGDAMQQASEYRTQRGSARSAGRPFWISIPGTSPSWRLPGRSIP